MNGFWYIKSDNFVKLVGVQNRSSGSYVNTGTFSGQLTTVLGTTVGAVVAFAHVPTTDGDWTGVLPHATSTGLVAGTWYHMDITQQASPNQVFLRIKRKASYFGK